MVDEPLATKPGDPYVQVADADVLADVAVRREDVHYVLQQLPLETIDALPIEIKRRRGFPEAWANVGAGIRLWPVPDAAYEVGVCYSEYLIARRKRIERDGQVLTCLIGR